MPKVTFSTTPVVSIEIKGEGEKGALHARDDGGLVREFLEFLDSKQIWPAIPRAGASGAGSYYGFFSAGDAVRIQIWLEQQGATKVD